MCQQVCIRASINITKSFCTAHHRELWNAIGNGGFIADATWPAFDEKHLIESSKVYPISINGKTRTNLEFPLDMSKEEIEKNVLADEIVQKWLDGKPPKKVIVVPGRIVNVVL